MGELPPRVLMGQGTEFHSSTSREKKKQKVYIPVMSFCEVYTSKSNNVVDKSISIERIQRYISDLNTIILHCSESLEIGLASTGTGTKWNHACNFEA